MGIRPDDLCTFCRDERESLIHLFWSCKTNSFWKNFQDWLIKNLILLKLNSSLSSAAVLGLKANFFSNTNNTSISWLLDITFGPVGRVKQILR